MVFKDSLAVVANAPIVFPLLFRKQLKLCEKELVRGRICRDNLHGTTFFAVWAKFCDGMNKTCEPFFDDCGSGNYIGTEGAKHLADAMNQNTTLRKLELDGVLRPSESQIM